jgi:hypothetical protein
MPEIIDRIKAIASQNKIKIGTLSLQRKIPSVSAFTVA